MDDSLKKFNMGKTLVSVSSNLKLFGYSLFKFHDIAIVDEPITAFVGVTNNGKLIMRFGKKFLDFLKTPQEVAFVIVHEILHIIRGDNQLGKNLDREIYNLAADHCINLAIMNDIRANITPELSMPENAEGVIIKCLANQNLTTKEVYDFLMQHAKVVTETISVKFDNNGGNSSCSSNGNNSNSSSNNDNNCNGNTENTENSDSDITAEIKKIRIELPDGQVIEMVQDIDFDSNPEQMEKVREKLRNELRGLTNSPTFKSKGNQSSKIQSLIEESIKVEVSWTDILEDCIKHYSREFNDNKTWRNIHKRFYGGHNLIMPTFDFEERYDCLVLVNDTSGSVSDYELQKFADILKQSANYFSKIIKIDHDYEIQNVEIYDQNNLTSLQIDKITYTGRGGTSHKDVYDLLEKMVNGEENKYFNDHFDVSLVLFLTDMESDIENIHSKYHWPKEIPYRFLSTAERNVYDDELKANVIYI